MGAVATADKDAAEKDETPVGMDKAEFVVGMLTKLQLVQWTDIDPFLKQFDQMDTDGSGRLTRADLKSHVEELRRKTVESGPARTAQCHRGCHSARGSLREYLYMIVE